MVDQAMGFGDHLSVPPPLRGRHRSGTGIFDAVLVAGGLAFTASLALSFIDGRYPDLAERHLIGPYTDSPGLFQSAMLGDENEVLRWHLRTAMDPVALAQVLFDAVSGGPAPYVAEFLSFFQHEAAELAGFAAAGIPNFDSSTQLVNLGMAMQGASGALTFRPSGGGGGWSGAGAAAPWLFEWPAWLPLPPWLQLPPWVVAPSAPLVLQAQLLPVALPPAPAPVLLEIAVPSFVAPPAPLPPAPEMLPPPPPPPAPAPLPPPPAPLPEPVLVVPEPIVVEAPPVPVPAPEPAPVEVIFTPSEPVVPSEPPSNPGVSEPSHVFDSGILGSGSQIGPYGTDNPAEPGTGGTSGTNDPTGPTGSANPADPVSPAESSGVTDTVNTTSDVGGGEQATAGETSNSSSDTTGGGDANGDGGSSPGDTSPSP